MHNHTTSSRTEHTAAEHLQKQSQRARGLSNTNALARGGGWDRCQRLLVENLRRAA